MKDFKYFIGYKDDDYKIKTLYIMFSKYYMYDASKIPQPGSYCVSIILKFKSVNKTLANSDVYKLWQQTLLAAEIE